MKLSEELAYRLVSIFSGASASAARLDLPARRNPLDHFRLTQRKDHQCLHGCHLLLKELNPQTPTISSFLQFKALRSPGLLIFLLLDLLAVGRPAFGALPPPTELECGISMGKTFYYAFIFICYAIYEIMFSSGFLLRIKQSFERALHPHTLHSIQTPFQDVHAPPASPNYNLSTAAPSFR
ncbi:MAG: hypothetical protein ACRC0O_08775 [Vibrio metschnikovii]